MTRWWEFIDFIENPNFEIMFWNWNTHFMSMNQNQLSPTQKRKDILIIFDAKVDMLVVKTMKMFINFWNCRCLCGWDDKVWHVSIRMHHMRHLNVTVSNLLEQKIGSELVREKAVSGLWGCHWFIQCVHSYHFDNNPLIFLIHRNQNDRRREFETFFVSFFFNLNPKYSSLKIIIHWTK